jgi:methyl-accepting chemotaxis protein I, serine sensor receptor
VRSLAQRSASAAREIKQLIGTATDEVHDGAALVARAGATMNEVVQAVRRVSDIVSEISTASEAQAASIEEVTRAVGEMDASTQLNAALVEQAVAAAASLGGQTRELRGVVAGWRGVEVARVGTSAGTVSAKSMVASVSAARTVTRKAEEFARSTASLSTSASTAAMVPAAEAPPQKLPDPAQPVATRQTKISPAASGSDDDWETF